MFLIIIMFLFITFLIINFFIGFVTSNLPPEDEGLLPASLYYFYCGWQIPLSFNFGEINNFI